MNECIKALLSALPLSVDASNPRNVSDHLMLVSYKYEPVCVLYGFTLKQVKHALWDMDMQAYAPLYCEWLAERAGK